MSNKKFRGLYPFTFRLILRFKMGNFYLGLGWFSLIVNGSHTAIAIA
ncbi:hypothetical protein [Calothrix rhizosoleniae]|nr:hypothetical protein [Calothrix rhizosoleniae]